MLTYFYCGLEVSNEILTIGSGIKLARANVEKYKILWIHTQTIKDKSIDEIYKVLKIAS
ncbi:hypothetical protein [Alkaliphilus sp. B6464]|uniref:hypothetical protein n=1 Tax=Alkaliphilus sp. B6464 TaxID=2731219 RepID=UPI001BA57AB2|nr:hypothetical protein [Alkaliphilus sp. B6464]QUH19301.1 hypothetical protein HYG84_04945 [Alkaliphilus sp. B6464]